MYRRILAEICSLAFRLQLIFNPLCSSWTVTYSVQRFCFTQRFWDFCIVILSSCDIFFSASRSPRTNVVGFQMMKSYFLHARSSHGCNCCFAMLMVLLQRRVSTTLLTPVAIGDTLTFPLVQPWGFIEMLGWLVFKLSQGFMRRIILLQQFKCSRLCGSV